MNYVGRLAKDILKDEETSDNMRVLAGSVPPEAYLVITGYHPGEDINSTYWEVGRKKVYRKTISLSIAEARLIEPMGCQED